MRTIIVTHCLDALPASLMDSDDWRDAYDAEIRNFNGVHSSHLLVRVSVLLLLARNLSGRRQWLAFLAFMRCNYGFDKTASLAW